MADPKNYVGNGWAKTFDNGGEIISLALKKADLDRLPVDARGDIRVVVAKRKSPSDAGTTHYVYEDTYKKQTPTASRAKAVDRNLPGNPAAPNDDLPF